MASARNRLYLFFILSCLAGYIWIYVAYHTRSETHNPIYGGCLIKHVTNVPCPSCGSTRSALSLIKGDFVSSMYWNPFGIVLVLFGLVVPFWILFDCSLRKDTFYNFYRKAEQGLKRKIIAIPALLLIIANWVWNIYKGL